MSANKKPFDQLEAIQEADRLIQEYLNAFEFSATADVGLALGQMLMRASAMLHAFCGEQYVVHTIFQVVKVLQDPAMRPRVEIVETPKTH
mgnify:CR=1 FL=1|tara:strand:- start:14151 stop:14420 length:270 start_codon:yes stop_codon:yes gene_type:complete